MPQGRYTDIVEKLKPGAVRPGEIVHVDGRVLGRHDGVIRYTVGQRRGLGIAAGAPLFVVRLDAENARVVVGPREALADADSIALRDFNWLGAGDLSVATAGGLPVFARVRSTRPPAAATLELRDGAAGGRSWRRTRWASRPARPACSTTATARTPACSAAARSPLNMGQGGRGRPDRSPRLEKRARQLPPLEMRRQVFQHRSPMARRVSIVALP